MGALSSGLADLRQPVAARAGQHHEVDAGRQELAEVRCLHPDAVRLAEPQRRRGVDIVQGNHIAVVVLADRLDHLGAATSTARESDAQLSHVVNLTLVPEQVQLTPERAQRRLGAQRMRAEPHRQKAVCRQLFDFVVDEPALGA